MLTSLRSRALITALLAVLGLGLAFAGPASAHDRLTGSDPADGATVPAPDAVTLTYNAQIIPTGARVEVKGPGGASTTSGKPEVDGKKVVQKVDAAEPGAYDVTWRVTSSDGHPISGKFSFTVRGAAGESASDDSAAPSEDEVTASSSAATDGGKWATKTGSAAPDGESGATSEATMEPTERVGTDETSNRPMVIIGLAVLAAIGIVAGGVFARKRLRDDE